ncbi:hypothetical protein ABWH96_08680 [Marivirga tractuosa]|uniref:hypothetical protein n=1 Tax=Marivirga tractuosa TaxID=1006 RepID=UPI0035D121CF
MNKLILLLFLFIAQIGFSQNDAPLIERKGNLVQNRYFILGQEVTGRQVVKKMKPYEPAHKMMKSSRRWALTSSIILGFGVGSFMPTFFDPSPEITVPLLITGVSLIAIAVPIKTKANRKADEAIELYNSRQLMGNLKPKPSLNLTFNQSGLGVALKF